MSRRCTHGRAVTDPARNQEIDLALAVLCAMQAPGQVVPLDVIAEVTGLSHGGAWFIEKNALKKLRNRLRFGKAAGIYQEVA